MNPGPPLRKLLIVSPAFPPMNAPDMQRVRMSLPYYRENGWEPIVLAVDPARQDGTREDTLTGTLPEDLERHHCGALPQKFCRWLGLGNLGLRAWLPLLFTGWSLIRRRKIDLVFLSNTQFATFTLGRIWRFFLGVPYVIDLQDPWRTDYYERPGSRRPPGGWKYQAARLQARLLEGWSFRRMSGFITVSENYLRDLRDRYRWFPGIPSDVIRFGASERDLAAAKALPPSSVVSPVGEGRIRCVYTGAAGPIMPHALHVLFSALRRFREHDETGATRLRFEFLGTSYAPPALARPTVLPEAARFGVDDLVSEVPQRLGHLECLQLQAEADVLLLLGSSDLAYSPSKLYPYFLADRPMLSVVVTGSVLASLLRELSCSVTAEFEPGRPADRAEAIIGDFFAAALNRRERAAMPSRNEALFQREYLARSLTQRQCRLFDRAAESAR